MSVNKCRRLLEDFQCDPGEADFWVRVFSKVPEARPSEILDNIKIIESHTEWMLEDVRKGVFVFSSTENPYRRLSLSPYWAVDKFAGSLV